MHYSESYSIITLSDFDRQNARQNLYGVATLLYQSGAMLSILDNTKSEEKREKMTGTEIKMKLVQETLSTAWLRRRLEEAGEPVPHTVLCNILRESRTGPQPDRVLAKSEEILNDYIAIIGCDTQ